MTIDNVDERKPLESEIKSIESQIDKRSAEKNENKFKPEKITRIIWFYENNTFEEFLPGKD